MDDLKPCPFCGGEGKWRFVYHDRPGYTVGCDEMHGYCRGNINGCALFPTKESAIEAWNRRNGDGE